MQKDTVIAGRFELLSHGGKGGMASVYRARDLTTKRIVAVKILTVDRPFDVARFTREATVLATVHHENVVDYIAHGQDAGIYFLAQEWIEGETLGAYLRSNGLKAKQGVAVLAGVAGALAAIHQLGVIHRDVKPSNIILAGGNPSAIKLVDFGIARAAAEAGLLTRTGVMLGTPSYMSPEQAQGRIELGSAADVWALGCVLYEMLTGRLAFAGKTPTAIRAKVLLGDPPPLRTLCAEAPVELESLLRDMLSKDPSMRPDDGQAVLRRVQAMPPVGDGPARRTGQGEPPTLAMPIRHGGVEGATNCFVYLAPVDEQPLAGNNNKIAKVATKHELDVHTFEDGSALLVSRHGGKGGAVEAARAALELKSEVFDGAVSVFGQALTDTLDEAIDRGTALLDRSMMGTLFGDGEPSVPIDKVIAELIANELPVDHTDDGVVLKPITQERSTRG